MRALIIALACSGCTVYFGPGEGPESSAPPAARPDASVVSADARVLPDAAVTCPATPISSTYSIVLRNESSGLIVKSWSTSPCGACGDTVTYSASKLPIADGQEASLPVPSGCVSIAILGDHIDECTTGLEVTIGPGVNVVRVPTWESSHWFCI